MQYSVLLLYPDYMSDDYPETYYTFVTADSVQGAIDAARSDCMEDNSNEEDGCFIENPDDLLVLLVTDGWHLNQKHETARSSA